jgi:hypothetical protein
LICFPYPELRLAENRPHAKISRISEASIRSDGMATVKCEKHGLQQQTFVCQHIAQGLIDKVPVGFFWTMHDAENLRPDAWCQACSERVKQTGGEWMGEALEHLEAKILCGACYDFARKFHMKETSWS